MLTYENRCHVCGENQTENIRIEKEVGHCQICGFRYQLVEIDTETDWDTETYWEELMGAKSA